MRIAVVTDSHLAPEASAFNDNWCAVREFVRSERADLTIHLGDITVDGTHQPAHFQHARTMSAEWPTDIHFLPGNHDIGDNPPGPTVPAAEPLQLSRLHDYRAAFGHDYWSIAAEGWRLIGLDAQLMGSETPEETEQWTWLASELAGFAPATPTLLFLHKPLFQESPADVKPHQRYVPAGPRARLRDLLARVDVRLVVSGHTHQYRDRVVHGTRHVWLPSTAFFLPDELQERLGEKVTGLGVIDLVGDRARVHLVCPEGVTRHSALDHPVYPKHVEARARRTKGGPAAPNP